jgi:hypothetical protein
MGRVGRTTRTECAGLSLNHGRAIPDLGTETSFVAKGNAPPLERVEMRAFLEEIAFIK